MPKLGPKMAGKMLGLLALGLVGACSSVPEVGPNAGVPDPVPGSDCAVIAAIALQHYRFGPDNPTLPLKLERDFSPRCDWSRYGLAFTAYDPDAPGDTRTRLRWVSFSRPVYDGQGAEVETAIMHGPLAGTGYRCRVISGFAGWTVPEGSCRRTWVN